ncbi:MAG: hypothetical protein RLP15_00400 [Cryomorphaceae bacterium]
MRTLLLCLVVSLTGLHSFAQPCVPDPRFVDRQFLTSDGRVLLLTTFFDGTLMNMMSDEPNLLYLNYVLFSSEGELIKDSVLHIPFEGYHYDYISCRASYVDSPNKFPALDRERDCALYGPLELEDKLVIKYDLLGDPFAFKVVEIERDGAASFNRYDLRSRGMHAYDDFSKYSVGQIVMDSIYPNAMTMLAPHPQPEADSTLKLIRWKLRPSKKKRGWAEFEWEAKVRRKRFKLNGYLMRYGYPPLVTYNEERLLITVFNEDMMECQGYGPDTRPVVYCFDQKRKKLLWTHRLLRSSGSLIFSQD